MICANIRRGLFIVDFNLSAYLLFSHGIRYEYFCTLNKGLNQELIMKSEIDAHLNTRCYIELFPDNKKNMQTF